MYYSKLPIIGLFFLMSFSTYAQESIPEPVQKTVNQLVNTYKPKTVQKSFNSINSGLGEDCRISYEGGLASRNAYSPDFAFNPANNTYLLVWSADAYQFVADNATEIFGQLISGVDGSLIGDVLEISQTGQFPTNNDLRARDPKVAYNSTNQHFLIVWVSDDDGENQYDIYSRRYDPFNHVFLNGQTKVTSPQHLNYDAYHPDVAYDEVNNNFLVVWEGTSNSDEPSFKFEIFGQFLSGAFPETLTTNNFKISTTLPQNDANFDAKNPAVAYNTSTNEFMVVWEAGEYIVFGIAIETEIYGQRINASSFGLTGNVIRLSDMGEEGEDFSVANNPSISTNTTNSEYMIVWAGSEVANGLSPAEFEIFGQRLSFTGIELGNNDFQISIAGTNGDESDASYPSINYNGGSNEYLVVWIANDVNDGLTNGQKEVYGQRLSGTTATKLGQQSRLTFTGDYEDEDFSVYFTGGASYYNPMTQDYFIAFSSNNNIETEYEIFTQQHDVQDFSFLSEQQISQAGSFGDNFCDALTPAIAYSEDTNQYLAVWQGDCGDGDDLIIYTREIIGQFIDGSTGQIVGNPFQISFTYQPNSSAAAEMPDITYSTTDQRFLVVWIGNPNTDSKNEVEGQYVNTDGTLYQSNFTISNMGIDGGNQFDATDPAIAHNGLSGTSSSFIVVWSADDDRDGMVNGENEIFANVFNEFPNVQNMQRVSFMGPTGDGGFDAKTPDVDCSGGQCLVVWSGEHDDYGVVKNEYEIFGQTCSALGDNLQINGDNFRISTMGDLGNTNFETRNPAVTAALNTGSNRFFVVWSSDHNENGQVDNEYEIFGQEVTFVTNQMPAQEFNPFKISNIGPDGDTEYGAYFPAVTYARRQYLVTWEGGRFNSSNFQTEYQIYGQFITENYQLQDTPFQISQMGNSHLYDAYTPAIVFNSTDFEYLSIWSGDHNRDGLVDEEFEIFGQQIESGICQFLSNDLSFNSQQEINDFELNYPDCKILIGSDLTISGNDISDLSPLENIIGIEGRLIIQSNSNLATLDGLDNLGFITSSVIINNNTLLQDLSALQDLETIGFALDITLNPTLQTLTGFDNLKCIGNRITIGNNNALTDISALSNLKQIGGSLLIQFNENLTTLSGLENITSARGLEIYQNNSLLNLTGLEALKTVTEFFNIVNNPLLQDVNTLTALRTVNISSSQSFNIFNNNSLASLEGLRGISEFTIGTFGDLIIRNNSNLMTCHVQAICDYLGTAGTFVNISNNAFSSDCFDQTSVENACNNPIALPIHDLNFNGFVKKDAIHLIWQTTTEFEISHFEIEHSLDGKTFQYFGKIPATGISNNNESYTFLHKKPELTTHYYRLKIVEKSGAYDYSHLIELTIKNDGEDELLLFPNPSKSEIELKLLTEINEAQPLSIEIFNTLGEEVLRTTSKTNKINVQFLPKGVYWIKVQIENTIYKTSFIKI